MKLEFDPQKNARNIRDRGLSFEDVPLLDWENAWVEQDARRDYGEDRYVAYACRENRLYIVCFTFRADVLRILSYRKANRREEKRYAQETADR